MRKLDERSTKPRGEWGKGDLIFSRDLRIIVSRSSCPSLPVGAFTQGSRAKAPNGSEGQEALETIMAKAAHSGSATKTIII